MSPPLCLNLHMHASEYVYQPSLSARLSVGLCGSYCLFICRFPPSFPPAPFKSPQQVIKINERLFIFFKHFLMWTNFKVFTEFVTTLLLFYVLVFWPQGMWDLGSLTRDGTCTPCTGRRSLNHWTAREVP